MLLLRLKEIDIPMTPQINYPIVLLLKSWLTLWLINPTKSVRIGFDLFFSSVYL
jgi:hypothetical protein